MKRAWGIGMGPRTEIHDLVLAVPVGKRPDLFDPTVIRVESPVLFGLVLHEEPMPEEEVEVSGDGSSVRAAAGFHGRLSGETKNLAFIEPAA